MTELFVYLSGLLLTAGLYLVFQGQPIRSIFGVVLIGNAVNLAILAVGRVQATVPPIVPPGADAPTSAIANPLPQALVLTALVISFGLTAFALALVSRLEGEEPGPEDAPGVAIDPERTTRAVGGELSPEESDG